MNTDTNTALAITVPTTATAPTTATVPTTATERNIVSSSGKVTGTEYIFSLGDTDALKAEIRAQHPDWGNHRVSRQVAYLRSEAGAKAAARLQADAFVGMQFSRGRTAIMGKDRDSGKSTLHFVSCKVTEAAPRGAKKAAAQAAAALALAKEENAVLLERLARLEALLVK
jgi:hypothetical protein